MHRAHESEIGAINRTLQEKFRADFSNRLQRNLKMFNEEVARLMTKHKHVVDELECVD
jgi:hypothetical protein